MATVPWPADLPQCAASWSETQRDPNVRTPMETGPPKVRRRYTAPMYEFAVGMVLEWTQFQLLRDFYDIDCAAGVNSHTFVHPYLQAEQTFRFMAPPEITSSGPLAVSVSMRWEQFPGI